MPTDLYGGNVVKPFLGRVVLKKLSGAGPVSVGTQIVIPHASALPRNPLNTTYLTGINSSGFTSGDVQGKRTPSCTLSTVVKTASFFTASFLNSLIMATDGNGDTDVWAILLDDTYAPDVYDGAKCAGVQIRQFAHGGPIAVSMAFLAMYGDNENPGTAFAATGFTSSVVDPGTVTDVTKVQYGGTADLVQSLAIDLTRPQAYVFYDDGTPFPAGIASGVFTGSMTLTQSVKYAASWNSSGTVNIGTTGAGVALTAQVNRQEDVKDFTGNNRSIVRTYMLYDAATGGSPLAVTAL